MGQSRFSLFSPRHNSIHRMVQINQPDSFAHLKYVDMGRIDSTEQKQLLESMSQVIANELTETERHYTALDREHGFVLTYPPLYDYLRVLIDVDENNRIIGIAQFNTEGNGIKSFVIIPSQRRMGIGMFFVQKLLQEAFLDNDKVVTAVYFSNEPAAAFWRSMGFTKQQSDLSIDIDGWEIVERPTYIKTPRKITFPVSMNEFLQLELDGQMEVIKNQQFQK